MTTEPGNQRPLAPLVPASGTALPQGLATALDAAALARLEALDPTGRGGLLLRVLRAFESSSARLVGQLDVARAQADRTTMRLVAHTLKSASASIGAMRLAQLCATAETAVLLDAPDLAPPFDALQNELDETLETVARMLKDRA